MSPSLLHDAQRKLSAVESFKRRFFTKSNLSMGIGWLVFLMLVFWASKYGGSETPFFDPYEILQVGHTQASTRCHKDQTEQRVAYWLVLACPEADCSTNDQAYVRIVHCMPKDCPLIPG